MHCAQVRRLTTRAGCSGAPTQRALSGSNVHLAHLQCRGAPPHRGLSAQSSHGRSSVPHFSSCLWRSCPPQSPHGRPSWVCQWDGNPQTPLLQWSASGQSIKHPQKQHKRTRSQPTSVRYISCAVTTLGLGVGWARRMGKVVKEHFYSYSTARGYTTSTCQQSTNLNYHPESDTEN